MCAAASPSAICTARSNSFRTPSATAIGEPSTNSITGMIVRTYVVKVADVGMVQRGDGSRLSFKAFCEIALRDLDRDDPIQARVAGLPHLSHAAGAERRKDFIRSEFVADSERHE